MVRKISRLIDGKERRRGINLLQAINAAISLAVLVFVQQVEHRLTAVETKVDIVMKAYGIEIPDYLRQDRDPPDASAKEKPRRGNGGARGSGSRGS